MNSNKATNNCCSCQACHLKENRDAFLDVMIVCKVCGNKRCPKATNHRNKCTGSNEPGQLGSAYAKPDRLPHF